MWRVHVRCAVHVRCGVCWQGQGQGQGKGKGTGTAGQGRGQGPRPHRGVYQEGLSEGILYPSRFVATCPSEAVSAARDPFDRYGRRAEAAGTTSNISPKMLYFRISDPCLWGFTSSAKEAQVKTRCRAGVWVVCVMVMCLGGISDWRSATVRLLFLLHDLLVDGGRWCHLKKSGKEKDSVVGLIMAALTPWETITTISSILRSVAAASRVKWNVIHKAIGWNVSDCSCIKLCHANLILATHGPSPVCSRVRIFQTRTLLSPPTNTMHYPATPRLPYFSLR